MLTLILLVPLAAGFLVNLYLRRRLGMGAVLLQAGAMPVVAFALGVALASAGSSDPQDGIAIAAVATLLTVPFWIGQGLDLLVALGQRISAKAGRPQP